MGKREKGQGKEGPGKDIWQTITVQADHQPGYRGEKQDQRDCKNGGKAGAAPPAVWRIRLHAGCPAIAPFAISSIRRSTWAAGRRSQSRIPVHSTQIVSRVITAHTSLSGSPP